MIEGRVRRNYEAIIILELYGPLGRVREIEAAIDTGFTEFLTLPAEVISQLNLPFANIGRLELANGSESAFNIHNATVIWNGEEKVVPAHEADATPLVGMRLLENHSLRMDIVIGGRVTVEPLGHA